MTYYSKHVFICTNQKAEGKQCCANTGGEPFFNYLKMKLKELNRHGPGKTRISKSGCLGRCALGPCIVVYPDEIWYTYQTLADLDEIIEKHFIMNEPVTRLVMKL